MLALAAEGTIERIFGVAFGLGHCFSPFRPLTPKRVVKRLTEQPNQTTLTKRSLRPCLALPFRPSHWPGSEFDKQPPKCTQNQGHAAKFMAGDHRSQKKAAVRLPSGYAFASSNSTVRLTVTSPTIPTPFPSPAE